MRFADRWRVLADSYFCIEELPEAMGNLLLQPDGASDAGTAFTRYTVAGAQTVTTQQTQSSSRTAYVQFRLAAHTGACFR